jgi:ergothioneine biosynthesis protein EgtB
MPKDAFSQDAATLCARFKAIRQRTEDWASGLSAEDLCVQTMDDVSPGKWHLAHVTWFWETFLLQPHQSDYQIFDTRFNFLFNSYYETVGERHARPERGFLTRPDLSTVMEYRAQVTEAVVKLLHSVDEGGLKVLAPILRIGFAHEEQHQELFLTDIKHVLSRNSFPEAAYTHGDRPARKLTASPPAPQWIEFEGGLETFGHGGAGFAFDNEGPCHKFWLEPFALASHPVTNGEFLAFIEAGGYARPEHWLSEGWSAITADARTAPFYWRKTEAGWMEHTLHGLRDIDPDAPVSHVDYYEASAFADWAGARLPDEREWELAARAYDPARGRWAEPGGVLHPAAPADEGPLQGLFGEVWEWTRSSYDAYPGFAPAEGAIGEYNGKFMCGQYVLRGGSCLSPSQHVRSTYRNFFPPDAQWQMTGLRLARDI